MGAIQNALWMLLVTGFLHGTDTATTIGIQEITTLPDLYNTSLLVTSNDTLYSYNCGSALTTPKGSFATPNYPGLYPNNARCIWEIQVASGSVVNLTFPHIDLEYHTSCAFDLVEVYDGAPFISPLIGKFCTFTSRPFISSSNRLTVLFSSDGSVQRTGFHAIYNFNYQDVPIRLVNGRNRCAGRIEVYYNYTWGTICDDGWTFEDAQVVCRQLGCGEVYSSQANYGPGIGSILMDDVDCRGYEANLGRCFHRGWYSHNCGHHEDTGVICTEYFNLTATTETTTTANPTMYSRPYPIDVPARLVNGWSSCSGRVEVYYNYQWGTVCHDRWSFTNARVLCRQLGCGDVSTSLYYFGPGSGPILLDEVSCSGYEWNLGRCSHNGWYNHNCVHGADTGVICTGSFNTTTPAPAYPTASRPVPIDVSVRLVNGWSRCSGRVEVYYNYQWGTVCDDGWSFTNARVLCRQLGCGDVSNSLYSFGPGNGSILLDDVSCSGYEWNLGRCSHNGWYNHNCNHGEDTGVICTGPVNITTPTPAYPTASRPVPIDVSVRLVNGWSRCSGRVEVYYNYQWGTVCDDGWSFTNARVLCHQLGCGDVSNSLYSFGPGNGSILLDDVSCSGYEWNLGRCSHNGWYNHNCNHGEDTGVICTGPVNITTPTPAYPTHSGPVPIDVSVRLVNGWSRCSGRVEVYYNYQWGTVCDDGWSFTNARVLCRQLGCGDVSTSLYSFGPGSGPILLDEVSCSGYEWNLGRCSHNGWYNHNCGHGEDTGVICIGTSDNQTATTAHPTVYPIPIDVPARLVNGWSRCAGLVEVYYRYGWGTVCNHGWSFMNARVLCRQLGCGDVYTSLVSFGPGNGTIYLDNVQCSGYESNLGRCYHNGWFNHNCSSYEDVGVICTGHFYTTTPFPWTTAPTNYTCGGLLTDSGSFSSPFYPSNYPNNARCIWEIQVRSNYRIELSFSDLRLEYSSNCIYDFIEVYDGPLQSSSPRRRICQISNSTFTSSSNFITVLFSSDVSVTSGGFRAHFYSVSPPSNKSVTLTCSTDAMQAAVNRAYLQSLGYSPWSLTMNDPYCSSQITGTHVIFNISYNGCGTVREVDGSTIVYSNTLRAYPPVSLITRQKKLNVDLRCRLFQNTSFDIVYISNDTVDIHETQYGRYNVSFSFYYSSSFMNPVHEWPYYVDLNQDVYVQARLYSSDQNLVLFLDSCVASPNALDFVTRTYDLIKSGCVRDSTFYSYGSPSSNTVRFRFNSFTFVNRYQVVFLQCRLVVCRTWDYSSRCYQGCLRRRKRDTSSYLKELSVVVGPVQVKDAKAEVKKDA
ncbi:deleted in malignant brain tumors 1 protein [Microcaecilia unicolor]|uniref:Scavenger receptor cysteine-rich domain-containing protein DMBT1 n=1 Tax=Microcaecilia unicolor TaxID=1415580 RepID=A0A6P7WYJ7_9AMPH|nr:deleted in malignant brain tumors 1 protein-like [Microcaecilia unicolor]